MYCILFEAFTAVTMKNVVFWDVALCRSCVNRRFGGTCSRWFPARGIVYPEDGGDTSLRNVGSHKSYTAPHPRRRHSSQNLLCLLAYVACSSTLKMEVVRPFEALLNCQTARSNIAEGSTVHSFRRKDLKFRDEIMICTSRQTREKQSECALIWLSFRWRHENQKTIWPPSRASLKNRIYSILGWSRVNGMAKKSVPLDASLYLEAEHTLIALLLYRNVRVNRIVWRG
jgi:hypothetical protein